MHLVPWIMNKMKCLFSVLQRTTMSFFFKHSQGKNSAGEWIWVSRANQASFCHGSTALVGLGLLSFEVSKSHSDTPHSVGLLWTSNRLVAETSTWQHTTLIIDKHPCLGGIRTRSHSKRAAANPDTLDRAATGRGDSRKNHVYNEMKRNYRTAT
jgi:hypothetical protein